MTSTGNNVVLLPRDRDLAELTACWTPSIKRAWTSMVGTIEQPEISVELSQMDLHWISQRLRQLRAGFGADENKRLRVMAALTRMFLVYPETTALSQRAGEKKLETYLELLSDLDGDAVVYAIEKWVRGAVPYPECKKNAAPPAMIRSLVIADDRPADREIRELLKLQKARVLPKHDDSEAARAERRAFSERMVRQFNGQEEVPAKPRKAVDL